MPTGHDDNGTLVRRDRRRDTGKSPRVGGIVPSSIPRALDDRPLPFVMGKTGPRDKRRGLLHQKVPTYRSTSALGGVFFFVWLSCVGATVALTVVADIFQSQAPTFPLGPVVTTSIGLSFLSSIVTVLLGLCTKRGFHVYQPFVGGQVFVVMQAAGYFLGVVSAALMGVYVDYIYSYGANESTQLRYGAFTVLGGFESVAQITLMSSLLFFTPPTKRRVDAPSSTSHTSSARPERWLAHLSGTPLREYTLVALSCVVVVGSSVVAEYHTWFRTLNVVVVFTCVCLSLTVIHTVLVGDLLHCYRLYMPLSESPWLAALQLIGWSLLGVALCMAVVLYRAHTAAPPSWHLGYGLISMTGLVDLVFFAHFLRSVRAEAGVGASAPFSASFKGPIMLTLWSALMCAGVYTIALVSTYGNVTGTASERLGFLQLQALLAALLFSMPPCTHLHGWLVIGRVYEVWMPFKGPPEFVLTQGIGWTAFATAIVFGTLHITERVNFHFVLLQATCLLLSQGMIHTSLYVFSWKLGSKRVLLEAGGDVRSLAAEDEGEEGRRAYRSLVATVMNGEFILAMVLGGVSLVLRVVCDVAVYAGRTHTSGLAIPTSALIRAAVFLCVVATPMVAISMRDRVAPFDIIGGSSVNAALQMLGWVCYTMLIVTELSLLARGGRDSLLQTVIGNYVLMQYTLEGFLHMFPLVLVTLADFYETSCLQRHRASAEKVRAAVHELRDVLSQQVSDDEMHLRLERLIQIAVGPRMVNRDTARTAEYEDRVAGTNAARYITAIFCMGCIFTFLSAAFLAEHQPITTLIFGLTGVIALIISSFLLHSVYGVRMHEATGKYSIFMPFAGGRRFVTFQAIGWISFTTCLCLMIVCWVERRGTALMFVSMCVLSVVSQVSILHSIHVFDPMCSTTNAFLSRNAEGLLSVLTLLGAFFFSRTYHMAVEGRRDTQGTSLPPIIICSISTSLAVALGLVSLERQAKEYGVTPSSLFHLPSEDEGDTLTGAPISHSSRTVSTSLDVGESIVEAFSVQPPSLIHRCSSPRPSSGALTTASSMNPRVQSSLAASFQGGSDFLKDGLAGVGEEVLQRFSYHLAIIHLLLMIIALFVTALLPFAVVFLGHSYINNTPFTFDAALTAVKVLIGCFVVVVTLPMLLTPLLGRSKMMQDVHSAICTFLIYSIPTFALVGGVTPPFLVHTRGTTIFTINMCTMAMLSMLSNVYRVVFVLNVVFIGYLLEYHGYHCWYARRKPFSLFVFLTDIAMVVLWLLYLKRYRGQPDRTGRLHSYKVSKFVQQHFFIGMSHYFKLRVINDGVTVINENRAGMYQQPARGSTELPSVNLSDPANQYIFSFHPHGIFPGTCLVAPNSEEWQRECGCNAQHFVSPHCADVIFSVPIMREFPLSLGCMSVSRKGIEASLNQGNSPLIVTGGQTEMLVSRMSDTEMHLVCHRLGFIRIALRYGVPLVPVVCFSESNLMDNVHCIGVQRWFVKRIGFPFPVLPLGRWWLPLPTCKPLTVVVGRPLYPLPGREDPDDVDCLNEMRLRYFDHVKDLFYKYRAEAGYPNMDLYFHNGLGAEPIRAEPSSTDAPSSEPPLPSGGTISIGNGH